MLTLKISKPSLRTDDILATRLTLLTVMGGVGAALVAY